MLARTRKRQMPQPLRFAGGALNFSGDVARHSASRRSTASFASDSDAPVSSRYILMAAIFSPLKMAACTCAKALAEIGRSIGAMQAMRGASVNTPSHCPRSNRWSTPTGN